MTGQFASLDEDLTGRENLVLLARLWGFRGRAARARADELLAAFDLADAAAKQVKDYSGGMRRRLDIAASLIVTPGVLFLDEPTTGLDPDARQGVWRMIRALAGSGVTILLTTQYLDEADQLAARIAVIDHGRKIAEGTSRELKAATGSGFLHVALADPARLDEAARLLEARLGATVQRSAEGAHACRSSRRRRRTANAALGALIAAGIELADFSMGSPSLDEVFFALTGRRRQTAGRMSDAIRTDLDRGAAAGALGTVQRAGVRLARGAEVPARARAAVRSGDDADHVHAAVHLRVRRRAGRLARRLSAVLPARHPGADRGVQRGLFRHGAVDRSRQGTVRPVPLAADLVAGAVRRADGRRHPAPPDRRRASSSSIGLILGYRPEAGILGVVAAFALLIAIGFGMGWVFIVLGLLIRTPTTVMTLGFTVPVPAGLRLQHHGAIRQTMPGWLRAFVEVNPVSLMTTAIRGLMSGTATFNQIALALLAPIALTALLAPLTLWLYRRR